MIQVGAYETQSTLVPGQSDPGLSAEILLAFATDRFAIRDKDFEFVFLARGFHHLVKQVSLMSGAGSALCTSLACLASTLPFR